MALDPQIKFLMELGAANQEVSKEKRMNPESALADFQGVAQGTWVKLTKKGVGVVEYKSKLYNTVPQGTKAIPAGTRVNLEYRKGYYISFW